MLFIYYSLANDNVDLAFHPSALPFNNLRSRIHPIDPNNNHTSSFPSLSDLQVQLYNITRKLEKVAALEGVIAEHDAIRREVGMGGRRILVVELVVGRMMTIEEHELERVEEEEEEQMARQKEEVERCRR